MRSNIDVASSAIVFLNTHKNKLLLFICLFFCIKSSVAQTCPINIDFELGNFQNWQCYTGSTTTSNGKNVINVVSGPATNNRHTIIPRGTRKDPRCGFPISAPNG